MRLRADGIPEPMAFAVAVLLDAVRSFQRHRCTTAAAAIAFHVLFSIFPLILLVVAVVGSRMKSAAVRGQVSSGLMNAMPLDASAKAQIDGLLLTTSHNLPTLGIIGGIGLIWSASGMLGSVRGAMELAWEGTAGTRPFVRGKLIDALLLTILMAAIMASFLSGLVLSLLPPIAIDVIPETSGWQDLLALARSSLGPLLAILAAMTILALAYKLLPAPRPAGRYALIGAASGAVLLEIARRLFQLYVDLFDRFDVVYGSIGSIIAFLFFVYLASMVVLFGAEAGASFRRIHEAIGDG